MPLLLPTCYALTSLLASTTTFNLRCIASLFPHGLLSVHWLQAMRGCSYKERRER